ncbi:hypothetical protein HY772_09050 [Candidatus Woesearchaeota archaeon]|nr:hypothetical protein [Candidatus Woesearchaeota archaeon]
MDELVPHAPIPYMPVGFTMTYQATIIPVDIDGDYRWVISPSDITKVIVTGPLSGTVAWKTKRPTIQVCALSTDAFEFTFIFTPTNGAPISATYPPQEAIKDD